MNDVNKELAQFDADEQANLNAAQDGLSREDLSIAQDDIAEERGYVASGEETAEEAEENVAANIQSDLGLDDPSEDTDGDHYDDCCCG